MSDDDRPHEDTERAESLTEVLEGLGAKLDTVAGATAAVASTQTDLLARMAEAEVRRSDDALEVAQRLDAIERQVLSLSGSAGDSGAGPLAEGSAGPLAELAAAAAGQRDDIALALDVLARMAEALERSDARTEDRLAAVRDAAAVPVADLQALLTARADRTDAQLAQLTAAMETSAQRDGGDEPDGWAESTGGGGGAQLRAAADRVMAGVDELTEAVRSTSWQQPEITDALTTLSERVEGLDLAGPMAALTEELAALRVRVEGIDAAASVPAAPAPAASDELAALRERIEGVDVTGPITTATEELGERLSLHTDTALAGVLRLLDERLSSLRSAISATAGGPDAGQGSMGFEAGAVMGAAQAAWNRLEQRLDTEFDDLGRQLQAMGAVIEQALATAEAAANRPVVTGDQLRRAASSVKDTVLGASRSRRDRRGGPRGLGPGGSP